MYLTTLQTELVKIWCGLCSCYISTQQTTEDQIGWNLVWSLLVLCVIFISINDVNIYVKYDNNSSITSFLNATLRRKNTSHGTLRIYEISMHPLFTTNLTILNKIKIILQTNKRNNLHNKSGKKVKILPHKSIVLRKNEFS